MEFVLKGLQWQTCPVYLDDVIVYGQHFDTLKIAFFAYQVNFLKI